MVYIIFVASISALILVVVFILIVVYVFLLFVHVFLSLSIHTYCCPRILKRGYPDSGFSVLFTWL